MRHSSLKVCNRMANMATLSEDKRPGSSAATNQRRAFLKPPRFAVFWSHRVHVNFPATQATRASIKMSFTMSFNAPCDACPRSTKGLGPVFTSASLTVTSLRHRWLYISPRIERQRICQLCVTNRTIGNSVRCFDHFRTLVAISLKSLSTAYL